jgi:hypothetical protein
MGYATKGKTAHTFEPSRSITGKAAKAANAWAWELCKADQVTYWSHSKTDGFRLARTAEERDAFGSDDWAYLTTMTAAEMLSTLATIDPTGAHVPEAHADACRKVLVTDDAPKAKRTTVAELRKVLADLAAFDLPEDARALLQAVAA